MNTVDAAIPRSDKARWRRVLVYGLSLTLPVGVLAQEINARVSVVYGQVATTVDRRVFQTLQIGLTNFINKRKWTSDAFEPRERIDCSFLLQLQSVQDQNIFQATLTVQAGRPIYNTTYLSPLINHQDNDIIFRYVEFQPLEFNENRVAGLEPLTAIC